MLLVLDVGNTNTVLGVFARVSKVQADGEPDTPERYERLVANWRVATVQTSTVDEYGVLFRNLFSMAGLEAKGIHGIVNAVAAFEKYGGPCVIVDFGTATTFDCVSAKGEYLGGVICPGIGISADALFSRTARLPRVEISKPARVSGTNTVGSLQSGLYYGYLGLVDGILELLLGEMGKETKCIATGGLGSMIGTGSKYIKNVDDSLTLDGLRIIWSRNIPARRDPPPAKTASKTPPKAKNGSGEGTPSA